MRSGAKNTTTGRKDNRPWRLRLAVDRLCRGCRNTGTHTIVVAGQSVQRPCTRPNCPARGGRP